jgi:hypothetical protein
VVKRAALGGCPALTKDGEFLGESVLVVGGAAEAISLAEREEIDLPSSLWQRINPVEEKTWI